MATLGAASGEGSVGQLKHFFETGAGQGATSAATGMEAPAMADPAAQSPSTPTKELEQLNSGLQVRVSDYSAWGGLDTGVDTGGSSAYDSVIAGMNGRGAAAQEQARRLQRDLECEEAPAKVSGGSLWLEGSPRIDPADRPGLQAVKLHQFLSDIEEPGEEEEEPSGDPVQELPPVEEGKPKKVKSISDLAAAAAAAAREVRKKNLSGRRVQFASQEAGPSGSGSPHPAAKAGEPEPAAKAQEAPPAKAAKGFSWLWRKQPAVEAPAPAPPPPQAPTPQLKAKLGASQGRWAKGLTAAKHEASDKRAAEKPAEAKPKPKPASQQPPGRKLTRQLTSSDEILRRGSDMSAQLRAIQRRYDGDTSGLMSRKSSTTSELTVASGVKCGGTSEPSNGPPQPGDPNFSFKPEQESQPQPQLQLQPQQPESEAPKPAAGTAAGLWARAGVPQSAFAEPAPQPAAGQQQSPPVSVPQSAFAEPTPQATAGQQQSPPEAAKPQTGAELKLAFLKQISGGTDLATGAAAAIASESAEAAAVPVKTRRRLLNPRPQVAPISPESPFATASSSSPTAPPALSSSRSGKEHSTAAGLKMALLQQVSGPSPQPAEAPIASLGSGPKPPTVPRVSSRGMLPEPSDRSSASLESASSSLSQARRGSLRKVGSKEDLIRVRSSFREEALAADALVRSSLGAALQLAGDSQTYAPATLPRIATPVRPPSGLAQANNSIVQDMKANAAKRGGIWAFRRRAPAGEARP